MKANLFFNKNRRQKDEIEARLRMCERIKPLSEHERRKAGMLKREAIDDDLSSQIFKQAHVLFKASIAIAA